MSETFEEEEEEEDEYSEEEEETTTIIDIHQDESNANKNCFLTLKFSYNQNDQIEIDIIDKVKKNEKQANFLNTDKARQQTLNHKKQQDPIILREHPPPPPQPLLQQLPNRVISLPGRLLPPPKRQVIIERVPSPPPRDIIIERWLDYPKQENFYRRIIHEREQSTNTAPNTSDSNRNLIIDWTFDNDQETKEPGTQFKINYLGVETVSPREYLKKYANDEFLIDPSQMSALTNELDLKVPNGEALAAESHK
jgi:hypothetical protein